MTGYSTVSELARLWDAKPRTISDLFYSRKLDDSRCQIVGGRRLIPADYVPEVERVLLQSGKLPAREAVAC